MKAYIFPGQGSQRKGMGEYLFDEFADMVKKADKILGYSIKELCLKNPDRKLNGAVSAESPTTLTSKPQRDFSIRTQATTASTMAMKMP